MTVQTTATPEYPDSKHSTSRTVCIIKINLFPSPVGKHPSEQTGHTTESYRRTEPSKKHVKPKLKAMHILYAIKTSEADNFTMIQTTHPQIDYGF